MLMIDVDLTKPPHHCQLEILVVHSLVSSTWKRKAVSDLQPGVGNKTKQCALRDPRSGGRGLELVTVLDQLHDHQPVDLDNLFSECLY